MTGCPMRTTIALVTAAMASLCGCTPAAALPPAEPISGCVVVDGDTLRCGEERIRLLAIDAPEKPGNCREGRQCAPGDPFASEQTLRAAAKPTMTIRRIGTDRFGRTLALIDAQGRDLSCHQLASRAAIYNPRWDDGGFVMAICPEAAARQTLSR